MVNKVMSMSLLFQKSVSRTFSRLLMLGITALTLSACSWFAFDDPEAKDAVVLSPLEVPPDLVTPVGDPRLVKPKLPAVKKSDSSKLVSAVPADCRCSEPPSIGEQVLPQGKGVTRMREGQRRWLIVEAEPEQVWPLARGFLEMRGYRLQKDEPAIGLLETDWKAIVVDAATDNGQANWRENLRLRVEPASQAGRTEIFLSQRHSQRVPAADGQGSRWELRPADDDRAAEMLNRLARYLAAENVQDAVPLQPIATEIKNDADGHTMLQLTASFDLAWRRTSRALDNLGFTIEDHDRANRIFHVYNELPSGLTEQELQHGRPQSATVREEYWLHLREDGEYVNLSVRTEAGQVDESRVARHVLNLLMGQFQ